VPVAARRALEDRHPLVAGLRRQLIGALGELLAHLRAPLRGRQHRCDRAGRDSEQEAQEEGAPVLLLLLLHPESNGGGVDELASRGDGGAGRAERERSSVPQILEQRAQRGLRPLRRVVGGARQGLGSVAAHRLAVLPGLVGQRTHLCAALRHLLGDLRVDHAVDQRADVVREIFGRCGRLCRHGASPRGSALRVHEVCHHRPFIDPGPFGPSAMANLYSAA
jgi:hypothetical protein